MQSAPFLFRSSQNIIINSQLIFSMSLSNNVFNKYYLFTNFQRTIFHQNCRLPWSQDSHHFTVVCGMNQKFWMAFEIKQTMSITYSFLEWKWIRRIRTGLSHEWHTKWPELNLRAYSTLFNRLFYYHRTVSRIEGDGGGDRLHLQSNDDDRRLILPKY